MKLGNGMAVQEFVWKANEAGAIPSGGGRKTATPEQLGKAIAFEKGLIRDHCNRTGQTPPRRS